MDPSDPEGNTSLLSGIGGGGILDTILGGIVKRILKEILKGILHKLFHPHVLNFFSPKSGHETSP